jgi:hypothetical protein
MSNWAREGRLETAHHGGNVKALFLLGAALLLNAGCSEHPNPISVKTRIAGANAMLSEPDSQQDELVLTPVGWYHRSCTYEIPNDATVINGVVVRKDGTTYRAPRCPYPPRKTVGSAPIDSGWVEWSWTTVPYDDWYQDTKVWSFVPKKPTATYTSAQAYYALPGIENNRYILQPVLQYGYSRAGGGNKWILATWHCNADGSDCLYSPPIDVQEGDRIFGEIVFSGCYPGYCLWTVTATDSSSIPVQYSRGTFSDTASRYFNWAGGVVEVYGLPSCNYFPPNGIFFASVQLRDPYGPVTPAWSNHVQPNITPFCGFAVSSSAVPSNVYLFHNPQPVQYPPPPPPHVDVGISGPTRVPATAYCTWIAGASGGTEPYVFSWTANGAPAGDNSNTLNITTPGSGFLITVVAVDANGLANGQNLWVDVGGVSSCNAERPRR